MTIGDLAQFAAGPIAGALVAWILSSRAAKSNALESRVGALEIAQATLQATVITRLDAIDAKIDALT